MRDTRRGRESDTLDVTRHGWRSADCAVNISITMNPMDGDVLANKTQSVSKQCHMTLTVLLERERKQVFGVPSKNPPRGL